MTFDFRVCLEKASNKVLDTHLLFWEKEKAKELKDYVYIEDLQGREIRAPIVPDGFFGMGSLMFWFASEEKRNVQKPESNLEPIWQTPKDDVIAVF